MFNAENTEKRKAQATRRGGDPRWRVRPAFLVGCVVVLFALILPDTLMHSRTLQNTALLVACVAIFLGWIFLLLDRPKLTWRAATAMIAAVYLVISVPIFFFELFPRRWFLSIPQDHWVTIYAWPWAHWRGDILTIAGVFCSLLGRGRARIAFVTAAVLLWAIRASIGIWVV
jgi:hypothetical protein